MDELMTVDDTPRGTDDGGVLDEKSSMDALTDILDEPETTDNGEGEVPADDEPEGDDTEEDGEEVEGEESEDSDEDASEESEDGPEDLKGGRFAPYNAKVRLPDGETTTVEELMKGGLRQSDYSRKTESLARERDEFQAERERFNQASQQIEQQREFIAAVMEQWKPQPPENPQEDLAGWVEYQQQEDAWNRWVSHINANLQQSREQLTESQREEAKRYLERERERLVEAIPAMRDPAARQRIGAELVRFGSDEYGFSPEEISNLTDHRMIKALFDLRQAKARSAKAPEAVSKVSRKPKVMRGSNRSGNSKDGAKRSRMERFRETGSARDAEAVLMDFPDL